MKKNRFFYMNKYKATGIISIIMLLAGLLFTGSPAFSQFGQMVSLPMVTSPSPTATEMNRYGEYPVSLYTGLVDITIPIYEIDINGIHVPVQFKYHASGLKYDDLPMELGYGWTLMAGGTVSESVRGTPQGRSFSGSGQQFYDPYFWVKDRSEIQTYISTRSGLPANDQTRLIYVDNGAKNPYPGSGTPNSDYYCDSELDLFSYNFLNHSGQMYYNDGKIVKVPANALDLTTLLGQGIIRDNEGVTYTFQVMDYDNYGFNRVWYLKSIISANKADTVTFDYTILSRTAGNAVLKPVIDQRYEWKTIYVNKQSSVINHTWNFVGSKTSKVYYPPLLSSIKYRGGKIDFLYSNAMVPRSLSEIKIYNNLNALIKTFTLKKPRTDWLDGIDFKDNTGSVQQTYSFEYNSLNSTTGVDYWGYYNGSSLGSGYSYIPNFSFQYYENGGQYTHTITGMDRTPNSIYMQQGMLTKIIYPTKGYTVFEYEPHKSNNIIHGGLRIKEVRSYNHDNTLLERKWYKYGVGESGNGRTSMSAYNYNINSNYMPYFFRETTLIENGYYSGGQAVDGLGEVHYTKTFYPFPLNSYFESGSTVLYSEVAEYSGTYSIPNGKTVYKFTDNADDNSYYTFRGMTPTQKYKTWQWKNGLLLSKDVFNSSNQKIYSLLNNYSYLSTSEFMNLSVSQCVDIVDGTGSSNFSAEYIKNNLDEPNGLVCTIAGIAGGTLFDYYNYYITTGMPVISSSDEYLDGVTKTTSYSNYNNIGLPGQMQITDSNGDNFITKYKYPTDLSNTSPYNLMVSNENILTPVIQQEYYKGVTLLSKFVNEYRNWGNGMFEPEILKLQPTSNAPLENRITYHNRDVRGNPRYISKDGAENVVYLWGYNQQYPIAEITGVPFSDVTAIIAETTLNTIAAKSEPTGSDWTSINGLRNSLPNAMVTTYTYTPSIGVKSMTDPRGVVTDYNYDNFGRLTSIVRAGKTIENYSYNYKY